MIYYDKNRKPINIDIEKMEKIKSTGISSRVFHNDRIILKKYRPRIHPFCKITPKMFKTLKTIQNDHFIELYEMFSEKKRLRFKIDAYTAKYYSPEDINIYEQPTDYILDNFSELEKLFEVFTNERIETDDIKFENSILTSNEIIIIDPDLFTKSFLSKDIISVANKLELLKLLRSILIKTVKAKGYECILGKESLFDFKVDENTDITHELSKKLKPYKKTIDYFKKYN